MALDSALELRRARPGDLEEILRIQRAAPQAAQWTASDYLRFECLVALRDGRVEAFIVVRRIAPAELELLNLAVAPAARRTGIARRLVEAVLPDPGECMFLEIRESNATAFELYKSLGFQVVGRRREYYEEPREDAIVMKFCS